MKVSVVPNPPRSLWSLPTAITGMVTILLGLCAGMPAARADDEEVEDPTANLIGLLDPDTAKPLMTPQQEKDFRQRHERTYTSSALKSLSPSNKDEDLIKAGAQFRVHRLTMPTNWPNIANRTKDLINDLEVFAADSPRAREVLLKAVVSELQALLVSDQPTFVKINAAWLLGRLTIRNADRRNKTPAVPYVPAAAPLIKVLTDTNQRIEVKVPAARGLARIMQDGDPSRQQRDEIAKTLTDELNGIDNYTPGDGRDWYHWVLVDALGTVEFPRSMTQQTYVVDALWKTMQDESLPWRIRTRAVRSLGQIKMDATFNTALLAHEIVLLTGKMAAAYNQNPRLSYWRLCFSDLYFAFKAKEQYLWDRGWGLLKNPPPAARSMIEGAYGQVLPIVNAVLEDVSPQPVPVNLLIEASKWLDANKQANLKLHQGAAPLERKAAAVGEDSGILRSDVVTVLV